MKNNYNDLRITLSSSTSGSLSTSSGRGAVASASRQASELAIAVLKDGGNAFDAAFALAFSLCIFHPQAGNLGGGGYLLYKEKGCKQPRVISYRERASMSARREDFLLPDNSPDPDKTAFGPTSVCVPGTVKAFFTLQKRHGKLKASDLLKSIARCADEGARVTQYEADCLNRLAPKLASSPESKRIYVRDTPYQAGDILRNPTLGRTLNHLAQEGEAAFYRGRIAEQIVSDLQAHGGFLTAEDLAAYEIREPEPICADIRGRQVWSAPPEGGGSLLLEIMGILNRDEFFRCKPGTSDFHHYIAQAAKIAFIDRLDYLGDVDQSRNAVYQSILDPTNLQRLFNLIADQDTPTDLMAQKVREGRSPLPDTRPSISGVDTTHFAVIDADGNAVSNSYTLNLRYGSKWTVEGAGFLLNGSVDSFSFVEGKENYFGVIGSALNTFAPGKRPASNMAPVLITEGQDVSAVIGTPGGPMIPTTLASILFSILAHGTRPEEAVEAGRLHHQGWPAVIYREGSRVAPAILEGLEQKGYAIKDKNELIGDIHGVFRQDGSCTALSDYRREGLALGY